MQLFCPVPPAAEGSIRQGLFCPACNHPTPFIMKRSILLTLALFSTSAFADSGPADEVKAAAKKLADAANYSWTTTSTVPEGSRFRPGPVDGKTAQNGSTLVTMATGDRKTEAVLKDGKAVLKTEAGWQTPEEMRAARETGGGAGGRGGFGGRLLQDFKTPAQQAADLAGKVKELKKDGETFAGNLTEAAVKEMMTMGGRRRDGAEAPTPTDAKGSVKFWVKDGVLTKYETHVSGKISFNGNEMNIDRTATTEIKEVGTSKVEAPEDAQKKINSAPAPAPAKQD